MSQKGFAPILMVLLVALSLAGYLIYQKQTSPRVTSQSPTQSTPSPTADARPAPTGAGETANWKTYNSLCGFTIKYPEEWKATKYFIQDSDTSCVYLTAPDYSSGLDSRNGFYIQIHTTKLGSFVKSVQLNGPPKDVQVNTLDDLVNATWSNLKDRPDIMNKVADKTYGTFTGKQFPTCCYESLIDFAFINGNNIYQVQWPVNYETVKPISLYGTTTERILSTLKFTQ